MKVFKKYKISFKLQHLYFFILLLFSFVVFSEAYASSLYFSPSSGSYNIGQYISTSIFVSPDQVVNAIGGSVSFPKDKIEITSISRSGSIINFWAQDPYFSNSTGKLEFEGVVFNPGFSGSAGKIITINFKAKKEGAADFNFLSGSVLAHDGMGTEVLKSLGRASFTFLSTAIDLPKEEPKKEESINFEIEIDNEGDATNPTPLLIITPEKIISEIEYFEIKIDENETFEVSSNEFQDNNYRLSVQEPGRYDIEVKGVNKEGGFNFAQSEFIIESLRMPVITYYPSIIKTDDLLLIKGTSYYPEANILIYTDKEVIGNTQVDKLGQWVYVSDNSLKQGNYEIRAQVIDERGAKSELGQKIIIDVKLPAFLTIGNIQMDKLTTIITITGILIFMILIFIFFNYAFLFSYKNKVKLKAKNNRLKIKRIFSILKEEVDDQINKINETELEKDKTKERLKEALNISESYIEEELTEK